jgi:2,3-bisphosphoglycerate-dependent phosphoglycerate mutase
MQSLILVKHSLPKIEPQINAHDWRLSTEGRARCIPLAEKLASYNPNLIVSSPEPKALETAQIVAEHLNLPLETEVDLHEHARRTVQFSSQDGFQSAIACFFQQPEELVFGEETAEQAYRRFAGAIEQVRYQHPHLNPLIVTHGTVISLFVARKCEIEPFSIWQQLGLPAYIILSLPEMKLLSLISRV